MSTLKLINQAFDALRWAFDSSWHNYAEQLLRQCLEEEKGHRGFAPDFKGHHTDATISAKQAAKLFAVKRVAEYLLKPEFPKGKDYLHYQKSCFIAAGMVDEFGEKIRAEWQKFDLAVLAALNYTDFVKTRAA